MSDWPSLPVRQLADVSKRWALNGGPFGSKLTTRDYVSEGVPVIRGTNLSGPGKFSLSNFVFVTEAKADELLANNAHPGDIVFTQRGTLGQVGIIPTDSPFTRFVVSQSQMKLSPDLSRVDRDFVYYFFTNPVTVRALSNQGMAAGVPHINLETLREFRVPLPPLDEQRRIAGILSAYDDLIENCERRVKVLDEMARSLYREWFVDFRYPGHQDVPLVDSALGKVPRGWRVQRLGDVLELNYGKALKAEDRNGGTIPVYASSGVVGWHDKSLANGPGVIVGRKGNVGSVFWSDLNFFVIDTAYFVASALPLRFWYFDLPGKNFINGDAAVPGLSRNQAYALQTLVPEARLLDRFVSLAEGFMQPASILRRQVDNLRATRDLLLPRLLSGQLSLAEAA